jgi:hypothetical protein
MKYKVFYSEFKPPWIINSDKKLIEFIKGLLKEGVSKLTIKKTE